MTLDEEQSYNIGLRKSTEAAFSAVTGSILAVLKVYSLQ